MLAARAYVAPPRAALPRRAPGAAAQACRCTAAALRQVPRAARLALAPLPPPPPLRLRRGRASLPARATLGGDALEVEALPADVRERVVAAVESLGGRVTSGDVAARAGLPLAQTAAALNALAADTGATLQVSSAGDLLYVFPDAPRAQLAAKSWRLRLAPALAKARETGELAVRVAFGATLIVSLLVVFTAITVLLSSSKSDDNERKSSGSSSGGGGGVRLGGFDPGFMNFYFWDPTYTRRRRAEDPYHEMGFLESVFSFVFGDGDPNERLEQRRWAEVGKLIRRAGGAVTAEQLAPLLEPPRPLGRGATSLAGASAYEDESFVLPALTRFSGVPAVTPGGGIVYRFPELAVTAAPDGGDDDDDGHGGTAAAPAPLAEQPWQFSAASPFNLALTVALGFGNAAGVVFLTSLVNDPSLMADAGGSDTVAAIALLLPALQAYAALFFGLPAARWVRLQLRNAAIEARNSARAEAANVLAAPPPAVATKLAAARAGAVARVADGPIVFSSDAGDAAAAAAGLAEETADFERRLSKREAARRRGDGAV